MIVKKIRLNEYPVILFDLPVTNIENILEDNEFAVIMFVLSEINVNNIEAHILFCAHGIRKAS